MRQLKPKSLAYQILDGYDGSMDNVDHFAALLVRAYAVVTQARAWRKAVLEGGAYQHEAHARLLSKLDNWTEE
jgi:hypothetical protein